MKKMCLILLLTIFWAVTPICSVYAAIEVNQKVHDSADLFSQEEETALQKAAEALSRKLKMDMVIVTVNDTKGKKAQTYADDFYDYNGFGIGEKKDGALLLIDMDNREIYISTCGSAISYLTDARIEKILDKLYLLITDKQYAKAAEAFLKQVGSFAFMKIIIFISISAVLGIITIIIMACSNKGKKSTNEYTYLNHNDFDILEQYDKYVRTTVTKVRIDTSSGSGGSGSSVHTSSSGRTHGGGGRKF